MPLVGHSLSHVDFLYPYAPENLYPPTCKDDCEQQSMGRLTNKTLSSLTSFVDVNKFY